MASSRKGAYFGPWELRSAHPWFQGGEKTSNSKRRGMKLDLFEGIEGCISET